MKRFILIGCLVLINLISNGQKVMNTEPELESIKRGLLHKIQELTDSIRKVDLLLETLKSEKLMQKVNDSGLFVFTEKASKLRDTPSVFGKVTIELAENTKIKLIDYDEGYFSVCVGMKCGYLNEIWIKSNDTIRAFMTQRNFMRSEMQRIAEEEEANKIREESEKLKQERIAIENSYIKKFGNSTYQKLKDGNYWLGMTEEMARVALGSPNDINRSVGKWGEHEQWIYETRFQGKLYIKLYLYFENGILSSYQN